jgi:hypothetical protein
MQQLLALKSDIALGSLTYAMRGAATQKPVRSMIELSNTTRRVLKQRAEFDDGA